MEICGQVVSGGHGEIQIRQKRDTPIEIGELLAIGDNPYVILMVYDLEYGSQLQRGNLELASGLTLEEGEEMNFIEDEIQNYVIAKAKAVAEVEKGDGGWRVSQPKRLPEFFSMVRRVGPEELGFITEEGKTLKNTLYVGQVRSGSRRLDVPVYINGEEALNHHILIPATTGRGKSNLVKVMMWHLVDKDYCGILVLDPHDEYYGRNSTGLKDHSKAMDYVKYYSPDTSVGGAINLEINVRSLRPWHFNGVISFSDAQTQAMHLIYKEYRDDWLVMIFEHPDEVEENLGDRTQAVTLSALRRKLSVVLDIYENYGKTSENGIFRVGSGVGTGTVGDIVKALEEGKKVIVDTSRLSSYSELLVGSTIAYELMERYRWAKGEGTLYNRPSVSIVLEEAVRVLGQRDGSEINVFGMIAREGRKFKIGLIAITQLISMIPREVIANMNTKIIMGNEMSAERRAIIESASQDLSTEGKMIASLDKGEAICSSIFTRFAVPIYTPLFDDLIRRNKGENVNSDKKSPRITYFG